MVVVYTFYVVLVNLTSLMCRTVTTNASLVCGTNNRTYPSLCHLLQQSSTVVRFSKACNRTDCPDRPVST